MQKIIVKQLGPVRDLEMEVKDFNLLIGEQATGKSTVAKAVYFFRNIKTLLTEYLCQLYDTSKYNGDDVIGGFYKVIKNELKSVFVSLFGFSWELDPHLYLRYEFSEDIWIEVKLNEGFIDVWHSFRLIQEIRQLEHEALSLHKQKTEMAKRNSLVGAVNERQRSFDYFRDKISLIFEDGKETYYIPAGRSMITLLINNRSLIESENLDLITRQFMRIIDSIQEKFADGIRNVHERYPEEERGFDVKKMAERLISDLKGDYQYASGKSYFIMQGDDRIPINFASSGQQEVLWLLNLLYILMLKKEDAFVIIEEPEAHLYPSLQSQVVEFISFFANVNQSAVLITTHSPYILTSVNMLYCVGKTMRSYPALSEKIYKMIGGRFEVSPQKITALKLNRDKMVSNLMNEEFDEINTEMIDEISDSVNEKYTELFYLAAEMDRKRGALDEKKEGTEE